MRVRIAEWWRVMRGNPLRAVGTIAVLVITIAAVAVVAGDSDDDEVSTEGTTTTSTTEETSSTATSATTTTTAASTTTMTAPTTTAPTTTAPPPPPPSTSPPHQVFVVQSSPQGLAAMNPDGSGLHLLVEGVFRTLDLAPSRSWLVLTRWTDRGNELFTVNADGSGLQMISDGGWQSPRVSPDGTKIAAIELREAIGPVLVIMNRSGGGRQDIHLPNGLTNNVDWSPDGKKLVVTNSSSQALSVYDFGTGQQTTIRPGPGTTSSPIWSPDGSRIAFTNGTDLVVIPAGGGPDQVLTAAFAEHPREIAWDGSSSLLFTAGATMHRIRADGSGLTPTGTGISSPAA